jgi:phage-related protein
MIADLSVVSGAAEILTKIFPPCSTLPVLMNVSLEGIRRKQATINAIQSLIVAKMKLEHTREKIAAIDETIAAHNAHAETLWAMQCGNRQIEKVLYSREAAAVALSMSIRSIDYEIERGHLKTKRNGRRVSIPAAEIHRYAKNDHPGAIRGEYARR